MYNILDLFAGAGGLSLGAARAGFNVAGAIEIDTFATNTHHRNFPNTKMINDDLSNMCTSDIVKAIGLSANEIHGIIGGPPCQGFSVMGHGNVEDARNDLFTHFFKVVQEIQPCFYVAENVPGILNEKYDSIREKAFSLVQDYVQISPITIKAHDYGAPTTRTRVFFIGYKSCAFPNGLHERDFSDAKIEASEQVVIQDALIGLPRIIRYSKNHNGERKMQDGYIKSPKYANSFFHSRVFGNIPLGVGDRETIDKYFNKGLVTGCFPTKHTDEVRQRYGRIKCGNHDKISKSIRLSPSGICPTIRAGTGPERGSFQAVRPIHHSSNRVITPREAARLQGFPDWFVFQPTIWHSFRQIGNSVSPLVAERILGVINQQLT